MPADEASSEHGARGAVRYRLKCGECKQEAYYKLEGRAARRKHASDEQRTVEANWPTVATRTVWGAVAAVTAVQVFLYFNYLSHAESAMQEAAAGAMCGGMAIMAFVFGHAAEKLVRNPAPR